MCGIFGIIVSPEKEITFDIAKLTVNHLFRLSESRGSDSSGLSILAGDMIQVYKKAEKASVLIRKRDYNKFLMKALLGENPRKTNKVDLSPIAIIGQTRMATDGSVSMHENNQPIICDQTVGVHNGIVVNADAIWPHFFNLSRKYEVDSEIIFRLIQYYLDKQYTIYESASETFKCIEGMTSIACMFGKKDFILLATNNGSLYFLSNESRDVVVFASERPILQNLIKKGGVRDFIGNYSIEQLFSGRGCTISIDSLEVRKFSLVNTNKDETKYISLETKRVIQDLSPVLPVKTEYANIYRQNPGHLTEKIRKSYKYIEPFKLPMVRCKKCILPDTMPFIKYDDEGVCNYCNSYTKIKIHGNEEIQELAARYRKNDGSYDCIVGLSGGRDSTYGLHYVKTVLKMNPVAYTYDWGMVTDLARRNISRICGKLGVEHILVSADIRKKRGYIKKNVLAWLKRPTLGMIPLFMAGDKAYFSHAQRLKKELGIDVIFLCENLLERTDFKTGFAGLKPYLDANFVYTQSLANKLKLMYFYGKQYLTNVAYINSSMIDTLFAYLYYYFTDRDYYNIYKYISWNEEEINSTLRDEYDWELADDTISTWRIGDGTASFYNYIYYTMAGFTENDTFRSNQIREGMITREEALKLVEKENEPRWKSIKWYCDTIGIDFGETIKAINAASKLYEY